MNDGIYLTYSSCEFESSSTPSGGRSPHPRNKGVFLQHGVLLIRDVQIKKNNYAPSSCWRLYKCFPPNC